MPNSYIFMGLLAVVCIILSINFMRNASYKEKQFRAKEEAKDWARLWNEQRAKEASENYKWCDDDCIYCGEKQFCKFSEV